MRGASKTGLAATILTALIITTAATAQQSLLTRLQERMDRQDEQRRHLVYSYSSETLVHKLDQRGAIEKTDTIRAWQKFKGDSLLEYTLLYSSDKKGRDDGNKGKRGGSEFPKLTDPAYDFQVDPEDGRIRFNPKKAKKGDLAGELLFDPQSLDLRQVKAAMPRQKWPVNEFEMEISFLQVEGHSLPAVFKMQAGWNAVVSQGRIRVESRLSDHRIYPSAP